MQVRPTNKMLRTKHLYRQYILQSPKFRVWSSVSGITKEEVPERIAAPSQIEDFIPGDPRDKRISGQRPAVDTDIFAIDMTTFIAGYQGHTLLAITSGVACPSSDELLDKSAISIHSPKDIFAVIPVLMPRR